MSHFRSLALLACTPLLFAFSCQKDEEAPANPDGPDTEIADQSALADNLADEMSQLTDEAVATDQITGYASAGGYPRITVLRRVPTNPDTVVVDFGPTNLAGPLGRLRRGQLVSVYTGAYGGSTVVTTPSNYYVNNHQVTGSRTVARTSGTQALITADLRITLSGGGTITYQSARTREQVAGAATPAQVGDDAYELSGTTTLTGGRGIEYTSQAQALRRQVSCTQYVSGTLTLTRRQEASRGVRLDFGTGACDNTAQGTLLASGRTFAVALR